MWSFFHSKFVIKGKGIIIRLILMIFVEKLLYPVKIE